jgi:hypothetical protein
MYIVACSQYAEAIGDKERTVDYWSAVDTLEDARELYEKLLRDPRVWTATVAHVVASTDYSPVGGP